MTAPKTMARKCVFCGGGKLSGEHVWSRWARDLLPQSDGYVEVASSNRGGKPTDPRLLRDGQGAITNKRLRRVCTSCNSGWMSRREEDAKAVVSHLITGTPCILTETDRLPLARWLATKLMVLDVYRDGEQVFTEEERRAFTCTSLIPGNLTIWLLHCGDGAWQTLFWSHAQRLTIKVGGTWAGAEAPSGQSPNLKVFLWGLGEALIVATYRREIEIEFEMQDNFAISITPVPWTDRSWPPEPITGAQAETLQRTLLDLPSRLGGRLVELGDPRDTA